MSHWIEASEHTYVVTPPEPNPDNLPYMDQGHVGLDLHVYAIHANEEAGFNISKFESGGYYDVYGYDDIEVGDTVHLVVVKYQTGGTFGSSETWTVPAIKKDYHEAITAATLCEGPNDTDVAYRAWDGYFEHIISVDIVTLVVQ